jgi:uncharacterized repeat protein (TIGR01451 family)
VPNITNTASVEDNDSNGDTDTAVVDPDAEPDLFVQKSDGDVVLISPTQNVVYTLNYGNNGNVGATRVILTETLPTGTTFNPILSAPGWVCVLNTCTLNIGSLNALATGSTIFAVTVNLQQAQGFVGLNNVVTISDDGLNGIDQNFDDNTDTEPTPATTISQTIFYDTNQNGVFDLSTENPLANISVQITDGLGNVFQVETDSLGHFTAIVAPGVVVIDIDQTDPQLNNYSITSNSLGGTDTQIINITSGQNLKAIDVGYFRPQRANGGGGGSRSSSSLVSSLISSLSSSLSNSLTSLSSSFSNSSVFNSVISSISSSLANSINNSTTNNPGNLSSNNPPGQDFGTAKPFSSEQSQFELPRTGGQNNNDKFGQFYIWLMLAVLAIFVAENTIFLTKNNKLKK